MYTQTHTQTLVTDVEEGSALQTLTDFWKHGTHVGKTQTDAIWQVTATPCFVSMEDSGYFSLAFH